MNFKVQEHEVVPRKEFAKLFEAWSLEDFINEPDVFAEFGFYSPDTAVNVCQFCDKRHRATCCERYNNNAKRKRQIIANMVVEKNRLP